MRVIKNQGGCGSCWAFSAIGSIEGRSELSRKGYVSLSEQQLVDCVKEARGCGGGNNIVALRYSLEHGNTGVKDYPYRGSNGFCSHKQHPVRNHHISSIRTPYGTPLNLRYEL